MPATPTDRLDGLTTSVAVKPPCVTVSSAPLVLSGLQTVGGVVLAEGDRVLVKDQAASKDNGIYVASTTAWARARDFDGPRDVVNGTLVIIVSNSIAGLVYRAVCTDPVLIGTSSITFQAGVFGDANTISFLQAGTGAVARTVQDKLRDIVNVADFGAIGDGTLQTAALQAALDAGAGGTVVIPDGDYITTALTPAANTEIQLSDGARLIGRTGGGTNVIFSLLNAIATTTNLGTALSGAVQITVTSTAGFAANDRVIVSAGTFTGSGVEEGPIEFNTVVTVDDATHLTLSQPLQYSYSAVGIAGAAPRVERLGGINSIVRNVTISGGRLCGEAAFSGLSFLLQNVENVTIENVRIQDDPVAGYFCFGTGIMTGHNISRLKFRNNVISGNAAGGAAGSNVGINVASLVESLIEGNNFGVGNESSTNAKQFNHLILEVTCRDNVIANNVFGPIRVVNTAAVDFSFYAFGNRVIGNSIWGVDTDIAGGVVTLGVRTLANGIDSSFPGNVIVGNKLLNIMVGIGDAQTASVITGNSHTNQTLSATSIGIQVYTVTPPAYPSVGNAFRNITYNMRGNTGVEAGIIYDGGTVTPTHGGSGSISSKLGSTSPGQGFWTCQPTTTNGTFAWYPINQMPSIAFAGLTTSYSNGTMFYVTDGTTGSDPLTGGGGGTAAIRTQNHWAAFPAST